MHSPTNFWPFKFVYDCNPLILLDFIPLHIDEIINLYINRKVKVVKELYESVR